MQSLGKPRLLPTIPTSTKQYDMPTKPLYLPSSWTASIHPEGQVYFACDSKPKIMTDAQMYSESTCEHVLHCAVTIFKSLESKNILLPDSAELYIMPLDYDDACLYYFVDHTSGALFWLEEIEVADLGLVEVISESHLGTPPIVALVLQEQYWTHIEQFSSHHFESLNLAVDELIAIFIHGEGDQMTSVGSIFAYMVKQAKQYTRILKDAREHLAYTPSVCIELERLYLDNLVYMHAWVNFVQRSRNEWKEHLPLILDIAIIDLLFLLLLGSSGHLAAVSLFCCTVATRACLALLAHFDNINTHDPVDAVPYLNSAKLSYDFTPTAVMLVLPHGMFNHGVALVPAQALVWLTCVSNPYVVVVLGTALPSLTILARLLHRHLRERIALVCLSALQWLHCRDLGMNCDIYDWM
ncbi:hypothetical protein V8D89_004231 [Ganoderma adspersum]